MLPGWCQTGKRGVAPSWPGREWPRRTLTAMSPWRVSPSLDARAMGDYALARRATLTELATGRRSPVEVCDAQTYLVRAARYHGERAHETCPVCERESLARVRYTFGDCCRREANGRAHPARELLNLSRELP